MTHDNWIIYILAISCFFGGGLAIASALWWDD